MSKLTEVFWESVPKRWCSIGKGAVGELQRGWDKERYGDEWALWGHAVLVSVNVSPARYCNQTFMECHSAIERHSAPRSVLSLTKCYAMGTQMVIDWKLHYMLPT